LVAFAVSGCVAWRAALSERGLTATVNFTGADLMVGRSQQCAMHRQQYDHHQPVQLAPNGKRFAGIVPLAFAQRCSGSRASQTASGASTKTSRKTMSLEFSVRHVVHTLTPTEANDDRPMISRFGLFPQPRKHGLGRRGAGK
jgi:hypothetical protein